MELILGNREQARRTQENNLDEETCSYRVTTVHFFISILCLDKFQIEAHQIMVIVCLN